VARFRLLTRYRQPSPAAPRFGGPSPPHRNRFLCHPTPLFWISGISPKVLPTSLNDIAGSMAPFYPISNNSLRPLRNNSLFDCSPLRSAWHMGKPRILSPSVFSHFGPTYIDVCQATMGQDPQSSHKCYKVFIPGAIEGIRKPVVIITCLQIELISAYRFVKIALHSNSVL
jgi:hypothetical protein